MSENINPEKTPPAAPEVPAGYDQPAGAAAGSQAPPSYEAPASFDPPAAPSYQQPSEPQAPSYPQPGAQQGYPQQNMQQGYQQPGYGAPYGVEQKSKLIAGILGILLGAWGIHRFYLGNTKMGVIQILVTFFTFGVGAIWGFIEGILILVGADPFKVDARGIPLKE